MVVGIIISAVLSAVILYFLTGYILSATDTAFIWPYTEDESTASAPNDEIAQSSNNQEESDDVIDETEVIYTDPLTYSYIPYAYYATYPTYYYPYYRHLPRRRYHYPIRPHRRFYGGGMRGGMRGGGMRGGGMRGGGMRGGGGGRGGRR